MLRKLAREIAGEDRVHDSPMRVTGGAVLMIRFGMDVDEREDKEPEEQPKHHRLPQPKYS
jgi:hypothetical protein